MTTGAMEPGRAAAPGAGRPMLTFDDLTQDLVWPRLLRAGPLSLHPVRLVLALILIAVVAAVIWLLLWLESLLGWTGAAESRAHLDRLLTGDPSGGWLDFRATSERIVDLFFAVPLQLLRVHPLAMLAGFPICTVVLSLGAGALSRMAATEFAAGRAEPVLQALGFARRRLASLVGAVVGPILVAWGVAFILAIAGFLLARWPGVNIVGALLYSVALAFGFFAMFLLLVYALGKPLLVPGVCCDGSDALDAIQRAYSYVLAKPHRLVSYLAILILQGLLLMFVVSLMCAATVAFTARATGEFAGPQGRPMVYAETAPAPVSTDSPIDPAATPAEPSVRHRLFNAGAAIVAAWNTIPAAIPFAFLFSYSTCAATLLYLGMRRICDGQDMNELWSPQQDRAGALGAGAIPADTDADAE